MINGDDNDDILSPRYCTKCFSWITQFNQNNEEGGIINIPIAQKIKFIWDTELAQGHTALMQQSWDRTVYFKLLTYNDYMVLAQQ